MSKNLADADINDLCGGPASQYGSTVVTLEWGDTAWNPASTKGPIHGPAKLRYYKAPEGWTVQLRDRDTQEF